jgi:hypothetical protein
MRRVVLKSPVLENCTPGSVRGAPGNRRPYLAIMLSSRSACSECLLSVSICVHLWLDWMRAIKRHIRESSW